jgi:MFS family permease
MTPTPTDPDLDYTPGQRARILTFAFLGWMFAGFVIGLMPLIVRPATYDLLRPHGLDAPAPDELPDPLRSHLKTQTAAWLARHTVAFLLGAGAGGALFGWLGDRIGRTRAMAGSVLCYSLLTGACAAARTPQELLALRFLACLGVGGMWPNGVALVAEAWPGASRPLLAGLIGTAANFGMILLGVLGLAAEITPDSWRWLPLVGAVPAVLGVLTPLVVPESCRWLAARRATPPAAAGPVRELLRPPLLGRTLLGIALATVPMLGTTVVAYWLLPWADEVAGAADPYRKAVLQLYRAGGAVLSSLLGGWVASLLGRRATYFAISLASLAVAEVLYGRMTPLDPWFGAWTFALGFCGVAYFGWLPLYLPELFPTRVRATGAGVTFNFGRVAAVPFVLGSEVLIRWFEGDYARLGTWTSLVFALGLVIILFAPDTTRELAADERK